MRLCYAVLCCAALCHAASNGPSGRALPPPSLPHLVSRHDLRPLLPRPRLLLHQPRLLGLLVLQAPQLRLGLVFRCDRVTLHQQLRLDRAGPLLLFAHRLKVLQLALRGLLLVQDLLLAHPQVRVDLKPAGRPLHLVTDARGVHGLQLGGALQGLLGGPLQLQSVNGLERPRGVVECECCECCAGFEGFEGVWFGRGWEREEGRCSHPPPRERPCCALLL